MTEALERLVQLYGATGKQPQATKWRAELYASAEKVAAPREVGP